MGSQRQVSGLSRTESFLERQMQALVMELSKLAGSKTVPTDTAPLGYHCDQGIQSNRRSEKEESLDRINLTYSVRHLCKRDLLVHDARNQKLGLPWWHSG